MQDTHQQAVEILGPYAMPHDLARLYYGRLLWRKERTRERMLRHWTDARHPYRDRFLDTWRPVVVREIPPVIGSFFGESRILEGARLPQDGRLARSS